MLSQRIAAAAFAAAALCLAAQSALAQASGDGRQGPRTFGDAALNESLFALNDFLQARQAGEDMLAALDEPSPQRDFATVARVVTDAPELAPVRVGYGFGPEVTDGRSLDLHLASFNDDLSLRGQALFVRVALAASGLDFADVAAIPPVPGEALAFGPAILDDGTLDEHMLALFDHMVEQHGRNVVLSAAAPEATTGSSFDRYGESLKLY